MSILNDLVGHIVYRILNKHNHIHFEHDAIIMDIPQPEVFGFVIEYWPTKTVMIRSIIVRHKGVVFYSKEVEPFELRLHDSLRMNLNLNIEPQIDSL